MRQTEILLSRTHVTGWIHRFSKRHGLYAFLQEKQFTY